MRKYLFMMGHILFFHVVLELYNLLFRHMYFIILRLNIILINQSQLILSQNFHQLEHFLILDLYGKYFLNDNVLKLQLTSENNILLFFH